MRNDHRHAEPPQKQSLKSVIKLYHRSENIEQKTKSNPSIFMNQPAFSNSTANTNVNIYRNFNVNMNQHAFFQIQEDFIKLDLAMRSQILVFKQSCDKIKVMIISYYDELIKILTSCKKNCLEEVQLVLQKAQAKFKGHFDLIAKRLVEIQNGGKKSLEHYKHQFYNLSTFEAPVFVIEGGSNLKMKQDFEKILDSFKPIFASNCPSMNQKVFQDKQRLKQNILSFNKKNLVLESPQSFKACEKQNDESEYKNRNEGTIKKGTSNERSFPKKICEFSCDQELQWNPNDMNSRKFEKKEMMGTEVILEEPSSCQDSILISEGAENF